MYKVLFACAASIRRFFMEVTSSSRPSGPTWPRFSLSPLLPPQVRIVQPVEGALAEDLVKKCPVNVFDIEDIAGEASIRRHGLSFGHGVCVVFTWRAKSSVQGQLALECTQESLREHACRRRRVRWCDGT